MPIPPDSKSYPTHALAAKFGVPLDIAHSFGWGHVLTVRGQPIGYWERRAMREVKNILGAQGRVEFGIALVDAYREAGVIPKPDLMGTLSAFLKDILGPNIDVEIVGAVPMPTSIPEGAPEGVHDMAGISKMAIQRVSTGEVREMSVLGFQAEPWAKVCDCQKAEAFALAGGEHDNAFTAYVDEVTCINQDPDASGRAFKVLYAEKPDGTRIYAEGKPDA